MPLFVAYAGDDELLFWMVVDAKPVLVEEVLPKNLDSFQIASNANKKINTTASALPLPPLVMAPIEWDVDNKRTTVARHTRTS